MDALENWIASLREIGDGETLDEQLTYRYRLVGFGAEPWNEQRLAYAVDFLDHRLHRLTQGNWINREREVLWLLEHVSGLSDDACFDNVTDIKWCKPLLKRHLALLYYIEHRVEPFIDDERRPYFPPPRDPRDPSNTSYQLEYEETQAFRKGNRLLQQLEQLAVDDVEVAEVAGRARADGQMCFELPCFEFGVSKRVVEQVVEDLAQRLGVRQGDE